MMDEKNKRDFESQSENNNFRQEPNQLTNHKKKRLHILIGIFLFVSIAGSVAFSMIKFNIISEKEPVYIAQNKPELRFITEDGATAKPPAVAPDIPHFTPIPVNKSSAKYYTAVNQNDYNPQTGVTMAAENRRSIPLDFEAEREGITASSLPWKESSPYDIPIPDLQTGSSGGTSKEEYYNKDKPKGMIFASPLYGVPSQLLLEGSVIEGVLETAINTDLPGRIRAVVTANVYDSLTGKKILIPQGSRILADYNSVDFGQRRVQSAWRRLIRPDGITLELGNMTGVDATGASGYTGSVNNHPGTILKGVGISIASSVLNSEIAFQAANTGSLGLANLSQDIEQGVSTFGEKYSQKALDVAPTITVPQGSRVSIFIEGDINLPPYEF